MEFDLHTYDIQDIVIALIMCDWEPTPEIKERLEKAKDLFSKLNTLCNESNDYTLHFSVTTKTAN